MSLSNAPAVEMVLSLIPEAHRSVAYNKLDPAEAWMILVWLDDHWGLWGTCDCERAARREAHKRQHRAAGAYAVMPYKLLAAHDEQVL